MNSKLTPPFKRGKAWEKRIAAFLPGAKLYGRGVSTPDFSWTPGTIGSELQFEVKSTSSASVVAEVKTLRKAIEHSSIIAGYNGALEIYEGLTFAPSVNDPKVPYVTKYEHSHTVVTLGMLSFWFNNRHWFANGDEIKGWKSRPAFPYYPALGSKLKEIFHKGLKQLTRYLEDSATMGGGIIIAAAGLNTRDQLCIIPNTFLT